MFAIGSPGNQVRIFTRNSHRLASQLQPGEVWVEVQDEGKFKITADGLDVEPLDNP